MSKKTKVGDVFELKAEYVQHYYGQLKPSCGRRAQNDITKSLCQYIKTTPKNKIQCVYIDEPVKTGYRYYFFEILEGPDAGKLIFEYGGGLRDMYRRL